MGRQPGLKSRARRGKKPSAAVPGAPTSASAPPVNRASGRCLLSSSLQPPPHPAKPVPAFSALPLVSSESRTRHWARNRARNVMEIGICLMLILMVMGNIHMFLPNLQVQMRMRKQLGNEDEEATGTYDGIVSQRSKRGAKRCKSSPDAPSTSGRSKQWSNCRKIFKVVTVSSKKKGETETGAKCRFCYKLMSYKQEGATSHLMRHIPMCAPYLNKVAKLKAQANLNFGPAKAGETDLPLIATPMEYDQDEIRRKIAKIIVHE